MNTILVTADTLEKALQQAGDRLAVPTEALEYETVEIDEDDLLYDDDSFQHSSSIRVWIKPDYLTDLAHRRLVELLDKMSFSADVRAETKPSLIQLDLVAAEDRQWLIGPRGETLEAIEYLVNRMISKGGVAAPPVIVQMENYPKRRFNYLQRLAVRSAVKVTRTQREEALDPMNSSERKIIHALLNDFDGIKTFSQGVDYDRRVVIAPEGEPPTEEELRDIERRYGIDRHSRDDRRGRRGGKGGNRRGGNRRDSGNQRADTNRRSSGNQRTGSNRRTGNRRDAGYRRGGNINESGNRRPDENQNIAPEDDNFGNR